MKVALLALSLILPPSLISAAAPPAACSSDEQCSLTQRSESPSQSSTDVKMCDCYAVSSIDKFDECEGSNICATAKCAADLCAGLTTYCADSGSCVLKLDEGTTPSTQAATTQAPDDNASTMNPANQQKFSDDLTKILYTEPNECTSSLGVSMAFSLVYPGATNDGITEIKNTFGYPDGSNLQLVWQGATQRMLTSANGECVGGTDFEGECFSEAPLLKIANSVWLDNNDTLNEEYAKVVGDYAIQTDFESPESPIIVNDWVKNSTMGLIDSIVDSTKPLFPPDILLAINSIYLKARWVEQFQDRNTNLDTFYATPSRSTIVTDAHFMHAVEYFDYSHEALPGYQILKLRLQQSSMSMIFALPSVLKGAVRSVDLINALDKLESKKIALALPKFKFESKYEDTLKSSLTTLGVEAPFTGGTNSLCSLLEGYDCTKLIITKVIQKTVIDVNEKGVEAAAVTAVGVGLTSIPVPEDPILMVLDHPFQFFVYDGEEELMLFEGRLGKPEVPEKEPSIPLLSAKHTDVDFWDSNFFVNPIEVAPLPVVCSELTTCSECLENEGCAHWTAGECMSSCGVGDASCYTNTGSFTGMTVGEICTKADDDSKDSALCGSMKDCTSCVDALKSDGEFTCMWFDDLGFCDTGCNMIGCGSTDLATCSGATTPTKATSAAEVVNDAATTQAPGDTVSRATISAEIVDDTTTSTTSSTVPAPQLDEINDPDSSGIITRLTYSVTFFCMCTTIFMAPLLCYIW